MSLGGLATLILAAILLLAPVQGEAQLTIPSDPNDPSVPFATAGAASRIYYVDFGVDSIQVADIDGMNYQNLVYSGYSGAGSSYFVRLDVDNDWMYWTEVEKNIFFRSRLNGTERESLFTTGPEFDSNPYGFDIDFDAGKIYWTDSSFPAAVRRSNLDGSGTETLVSTGLLNPFDIHLDLANGKMYWVDLSVHKIFRADTSGSNVETLNNTVSIPYGFDLDISGGKMYWTDATQQLLARSNLDGTDIDTLATGGSGCFRGLAVDPESDWIYFAHCDKIFRIDSAGITLEELPIVGLNIPFGLTLEFSSTTAVGPAPTGIPRLQLGAPRPSPSVGSVTIDLTLAKSGRVRVDVFNIAGRRLVTLMDSWQPAGTRRVTWDGMDASAHRIPSGVYFVRASAGSESVSQRVIFAR